MGREIGIVIGVVAFLTLLAVMIWIALGYSLALQNRYLQIGLIAVMLGLFGYLYKMSVRRY
jgi:hypothetical protein